MGKKKKSYTIEFYCVEDRSNDIVKQLARSELNKVFTQYGAVCHNLEEVLNKYIK